MKYLNAHFVINTNAVDTVFDAEWTAPFDGMVLDHVEVGSTDAFTAAVMIQHRRGDFGAVIHSGVINGGLGMDNQISTIPHLPLARGDIVRVRILLPNAVAAVQVDIMAHREE